MICTETIEIAGKAYVRTWSDLGVKIERDNERYDEAVDPVGLNRVYRETDVHVTPVEVEESDYLAALRSLGVDV